MNELKILIGNSMMIFLGGLAVLYFIATVITTIKNNRKKVRNKKVNYIRFNPKKIVANYDEFINENTKNMFLFEKKEFIKNVNSELYSMILKGVR